MCHNHPSGNLKPSQSDIDITKKLKECAKLFEMQVLDHIILAPREESIPAVSESTTYQAGQYYSFADEGII
ncbi:MAG TPA: JAB domain-containing protein [Cyclobacteriaceae bacterium]|nr:JAB domain-containing protein [Cyclobacteriaceae bacterium]